MTARQAVLTFRALARAVPRAPILIAPGVALAGVAIVAEVGGHRGAILALQASTIALAGLAATLLEEPRAVLEPLPTSLARRRGLLLGGALAPFAALWMVLLAVGGAGGVEAGALTIQLAAVTALALGFAACGGDTARAVGQVALAFGTGRILLGAQLFPTGTEAAHWTSARGWWAGAACVGVALLVVASRDVAARRLVGPGRV